MGKRRICPSDGLIVPQGSGRLVPVFAALALILAFTACASDPSLADGTYQAFADGAEERGWTAAAELSVSGGRIESVYLDYIGQSGELLRHERYAADRFAARYGEDPAATLDALAEVLLDAGSIPESFESANTFTVDQMRALTERLLERAQAGEAESVLVETGASADGPDLLSLSTAFAADTRSSARRLARGGASGPGDPAGGYAAVSSHSIATEAAMEVLRAGGTAADAAVVLGTTISVVEPFLSHALGGGSWMLYYDAQSGEVAAYDSVGPTPMAATRELFEEQGFHGENGIHRSNVPGAWGGYIELLKDFGSMPLDELLEPAISRARDGFPVSSQMLNWLPARAEIVSSRPDSAAVFLPGGELPSVGEQLTNENLAVTFEQLATAYAETRERGELTALDAAADYYYRGPIAEEIVRYSQANNGLFALSDFNDFRGYGRVDPIRVNYRGVEVYQSPPNSQGITQLQALNILEGYDFSDLGPNHPEVIHLMTEALKLSFADRNRYVADPAFYDVPVEALLSREHAEAQRQLISMNASLEHPIEDVMGMGVADPRNTSTFHAVDQYGNMVAITSSIGASFMIAGETGITLNQRLSFMSTDPDDPNRIEPGKKVRHSAGPYLAVRDGQPYIAGGNTGADFQPQGQLQQFINIFEFGLDPQDVVDLPRFQPQAFAATNYPFAARTRLALEEGRFSQEVQDDLRARGQNVESASYFGRQNVIVVDDHGASAIRIGSESREEDSLGLTDE